MTNLVDPTTLSNEDLRKLIYEREQTERNARTKVRDEFIEPFNTHNGIHEFDKEIEKLENLKAYHTVRYLSKNIPEQYQGIAVIMQSEYGFMVPLTDNNFNSFLKGVWLEDKSPRFGASLSALDTELYDKCQYYDLLETILSQKQIRDLCVGSMFKQLLITRDCWYGLKLISNTRSDNKPSYQWFRAGQLQPD
jgi:hypothetical protein